MIVITATAPDGQVITEEKFENFLSVAQEERTIEEMREMYPEANIQSVHSK